MRKKMKHAACLHMATLALAAASVILSGCGESKTAKEARLEGIGKMEAEQYEEAIVSFENALKHGDGVVDEFELDILKYRGEAEYLLGDYEAAAHTYRVLAEVDDGKPEYVKYQHRAEVQVLNQQGLELLAAGEYTEALAVFEEGMVLAENRESAEDTELSSMLQYNIGVVYERQGDFEKALAHFREYVSAYGSTPELEKEIAFLESRQNGGEEWQN